jgi:hypothetical protein
MDRNEYLYLENEIGTRFSKMDAALASATERLAADDKIEAQKAITIAHTLVGESGSDFAQIAAAMRATLAAPPPDPPVIPPAPPVPTPVPPPPAPITPAPEPPPFTYPEPNSVNVIELGWAGRYLGPEQSTMINAYRFVAQKSGRVDLSVAEYQSPATMRACSISTVAGDIAGVHGAQGGNGTTAAASFNVVAGQTYFFNDKAWYDGKPTATYAVQNVTMSGQWPR